MVIATNLTSICCVYKEKIVLTEPIPKTIASIKIQKVATYDSDRKKINLIPNKSFRYYNLIIDNFLTHSYLVDIS